MDFDRLALWCPFAIAVGLGVLLIVRVHADYAAMLAAWLYLALLWGTFQLGRGRYY